MHDDASCLRFESGELLPVGTCPATRQHPWLHCGMLQHTMLPFFPNAAKAVGVLIAGSPARKRRSNLLSTPFITPVPFFVWSLESEATWVYSSLESPC